MQQADKRFPTRKMIANTTV